MKNLILSIFTALFVCFVATPVVQADVNEFEIVVANGLADFKQVHPDGLLAKSSIKLNITMSKTDELYTASVEKIKQDKLNQRRTVLSKIDQEFVDKTVLLGAELGKETDKSIVASASDGVQKVARKVKPVKKEAVTDKDASDGLPTVSNTKKEIQEYLTANGIEFETDANKDALLALVKPPKQ